MERLRLVHMDSLCCEPILRRMPNGELLIVAQIGDVKEPAPGNRVITFHSKDEGENWIKGETVWPEDGQAVYLTEVTVMDGVTRVYLTLHNGHFIDWKCRVVASHDNGYTWVDEGPSPCFDKYTFHRGQIRLQSGELIMAYQHYPVTEEENQRQIEQKGRFNLLNINTCETGLIGSSDEGKTWYPLGCVQIPFGGDTGRNWVWSEPTLHQRKDGTIVMLMRVNETGYLWQSESTDDGRTFSEPVKTDIPNPSNKPKLLALEDGRVALIHTPNRTCGMRHRWPLAAWISHDDARTWTEKKIISNYPACFCYPDGIVENNRLIFAIETNRREILFVDYPV